MPLTFTVETLSRLLPHEGILAEAALGTRPNFVMPQNRARFPRTARLLRHADFERVYKQGRRHFSASMTVFYWPRVEPTLATHEETRTGASAPHGLRVGFTVGRVLGGAVQRNRMKRRLREAVRLSLSLSPSLSLQSPVAGMAADVVINPKKSLLTADFADVLNEVRRAFEVIEQKLSNAPLETSAAEASLNKKAGNRKTGSRKPEAGKRS
ncbi:MAG: ribonuclease P protein component [Candidatus Sulfotelmatobacter sp.]